MYDRDQSGSLSTLELRAALHAAGYRLNYRVLNALVLRYGNREGTLGFDDFIMCTIKLKTMIGKAHKFASTVQVANEYSICRGVQGAGSLQHEASHLYFGRMDR